MFDGRTGSEKAEVRDTVVKSEQLDYLGSNSSFAMNYMTSLDIICLCLISLIYLPFRGVARVKVSTCKARKSEPDAWQLPAVLPVRLNFRHFG